MSKKLLVLLLIITSFTCEAKKKLAIAGSGWDKIAIIDKNTAMIEWEYPVPAGGECNSISVLKSGDVLFSYKKGARLVNRKGETLWDYTVDKAENELQSASVLKDGGYLLGICGNPAKLIELDSKGKVRKEISFDTDIQTPHAQFRQVIKGKNGLYRVPLLGKQSLVDIDDQGKIVKTTDLKVASFSLVEFKDKLIVSGGDSHNFYIWDLKGQKAEKCVKSNDINGAKFLFVAQILPVDKGNLLICNWNGHAKAGEDDEPQLIEIDKRNQVIWKLHDRKHFGMISAVYQF